jgi:hypothetical protein
VQRAVMIVELCERFHCTPSQLMEEDAEIIQMVRLADLYRAEIDAE